MLEYDRDKLHPLFESLSQESLKAFKRIIKSDDGEEKTYFPIVPDLNNLSDKSNGNTNPFKYDYDDFPKIGSNYFTTIKGDIKKRLHKMLIKEINNRFKEKWILRNTLKLVSGMVSKRATKVIIKMMKKDFENRNMISN
jgi:hypothetical protein